MNNKMIQFLLLCALLLVPGMAQDNTTEPRAIKGGRIQVIVKNIPAEDTANVNGEYSVNRGDGTISLPYLSKRIHVEGLTARDIESVVRSNYLS